MSIDLFLSLTNHTLHFPLNLRMSNTKLSQSQFIISSLVKSVLNFLSQFLSGVLQLLSQVINFSCMISVAVLHLVPHTFQIIFIKFADLDLVQLNFSLVMLDNIFNLMLQLIVVLFDILKTFLLITLQVLIDLENSSDFLLLGCNDSSQNFEIIIVIVSQVSFSLSIGLSFLGKLTIIVTCQFFNSLSVTIVIILELIPEVSIVIDKSGNFSFSLLSCPLQPIVALLNLMLFLFNLIIKSLDLSLMKILQLIFILSMLSDQIVLDILVFSFDKIDLMCFLFF